MKKTDKIKRTVLVHVQDDVAGRSSIIYSDSECVLLLMMHITDSYQLNVTFEERPQYQTIFA